MKKQLKRFLLIMSVLSIGFTSQTFANDKTTSPQENPIDLIIQAQYKNNPKEFLYEKLFVEPTNKGCWLGFFTKLLPTFGIESLIIPDINKLLKKLRKNSVDNHCGVWPFDNHDDDDKTPKDVMFNIGVKTVLASITYFLLHQFVSKPLSYRQNRLPAFLTFLSRWKTFKKYSPKELYPFFDTLYEKYKEGALTKEELTVTIPKSLEQIKKFINSK